MHNKQCGGKWQAYDIDTIPASCHVIPCSHMSIRAVPDDSSYLTQTKHSEVLFIHTNRLFHFVHTKHTCTHMTLHFNHTFMHSLPKV